MNELGIGKLDSGLLQTAVLDRIGHRRGEVKTGGGIGEDCAVVSFGRDCVISSDPITADKKDIGRLSVLISCNDVASTGANPIGITLTVLLPEGTTAADVKTIVDQAESAAKKVGVEIVGGHTEVTRAVTKPVICATAFGEMSPETAWKKDPIQAGDAILMTKFAGLEGTGILAADRADELRGVLTRDERAISQALLDYVSVVPDGRTAAGIGTSGMHDATEGGVYGAIWELAKVNSVGAWIERDKIPVLSVTRKLAAHYQIDPYRLIASGSMLIAARPEKAARISIALNGNGIPCTQIGVIMDESEGVMEVNRKRLIAIAPPARDELYRVVR